MVAIARTKKTRVSRQTELQQKLKKLQPFFRRGFIGRDLTVAVSLFDPDDREKLLEVFFRYYIDGTRARLHNNITYKDKTDKRRLLRLSQVRYRLDMMSRCAEMAKGKKMSECVRCFTAHSSNRSRLLSYLCVSGESVSVCDCENSLQTGYDSTIDISRLADILVAALAHFDSEMQRLEISLPLLDDDNAIEVVVKEPEPISDTGSNEK